MWRPPSRLDGRSSRRLLGGTDRELLGLAVPALGALLAEPAFLLADSAIIGRLGTAQLAGLGIASAVMLNAVFLCIFLAHGTTAAVARRAGAGDLRRAYTLGIDGIFSGGVVGHPLPSPSWYVPMLAAGQSSYQT